MSRNRRNILIAVILLIILLIYPFRASIRQAILGGESGESAAVLIREEPGQLCQTPI